MHIYDKSLADPESLTRQCNCVDWVKFICALLVIMLHTSIMRDVNPLLHAGIQNYISRLAVPFFFTAAGYFLFRKTDEHNFDKAVPLRYASRLLRLYLIWTVIYAPLSLIELADLYDHPVLEWIHYFLLCGSFPHLWYLRASIVASLILTFLMCRRVPLKAILTAATILYILGTIPYAYAGLLKRVPLLWNAFEVYERIFITTRNGLLEGFLFMSLGMWLAYRPLRMRIRTIMTGFILSFLLLFVEAAVIYKMRWATMTDTYLLLPAATFFLFVLSARIELAPGKGYRHLRSLSTIVYLTHMIFVRLAQRGCAHLARRLNLPLNHTLVIFFAALLPCLAAAICIQALARKFPWIKKLYA